MDRLRPILKMLGKYQFWILCCLFVGVLVFGWWSAVSEMPGQFTQDKAKVDQQFKRISNVTSRSLSGPNWADTVQKKGSDLKSQLAAVTSKLEQSQAMQRKWPEELSEDFRTALSRRQRSEEWPVELTTEYQKVAPKEVEALRKLINAAEGDDEGGVHWKQESYDALRSQFEWPAPPNAAAMFDAQEQLWVAQTLLSSIAEINAGKTDEFNLPISGIEVFEIGPAAVNNWVAWPVDSSAPAPPPENPPNEAGAAAANEAPPTGGMISKTVSATPPAPIVGLRAFPVRLRLRMDLAATAQLLSSLASQRTTVIVDSVRIMNPLTMVDQSPPQPERPAPPAAPPARGQDALGQPPVQQPAPEPTPPPAPTGPPQLIQLPRGSIVDIQATVYLADPTGIELIQVAGSGSAGP